jgi:RNA polymerase sigma-70 factor (ECF subfamily)
LVERHRDLAFRVAYLVTGSAADAEDAAQEGFVKAYTQIRRFKPGSPFRPWLLKIVGNEARNRRRSEGRRLAHELRAASRADPSSEAPRPDTEAERSDIDTRLLAAVNRLPTKERLVVGLRYFLELSEAETATVAGVPRGTVKSRVSRALGRLRSELEDLDV